ncbi:MAG: Na+/H+ antiporter subunit B [Bacteroidia bacterium]|jgi:multicomponent Na+:H+ antiporter subunit B|nr:Na+/H+ antiporter subunit B [Bacteroidia bacterium]
MHSLIFKTASRILLPVLLLFSLFILFRGHHEPGGGFVGGLIAAMAFAMDVMARGVKHTKKYFPKSPVMFLLPGLIIALGSGIAPVFAGLPVFSGLWDHTTLPGIGHMSNILMFDIGVYLVVMGVTTSIVLNLNQTN